MVSTATVVLVTGCSTGGIGFHLSVILKLLSQVIYIVSRCEEFAKSGCKVYATSRNIMTMDGFKDTGIEKLSLDVTSDDDVENVIKTVLDAEGKIDILVNNAGISGISVWGLSCIKN